MTYEDEDWFVDAPNPKVWEHLPAEYPNVRDGGLWKGPTEAEWVERIARGSTPVREYDEHGRFQAWIRPSEPSR